MMLLMSIVKAVSDILIYSQRTGKKKISFTSKQFRNLFFFFANDYLSDYYIDNYTSDLNVVYEKYKAYFLKSYDVKVYGQEWDMSPADPVILKGVIAADADELERKIREKLKDVKSNIYSITKYEVINNEHEQKT